MVLKKINFARLFFVGVLASSLISVVSCESGSLDGEVTEFTNGPGAFFTTTLSGEDNLTANFTADSSLDAVSYEWDFGDGVGTSSDANPEYVYSENGEFTVTLTTVDSDGVETVSTQVISVVEVDVPEVDVPTGVQPTFAAVILNGGAEMFSFRDGFDVDGAASVPEGVDNDQDNADSFDMTPSSTIILDTGEEVPTIFTWSNSALNTFIETISTDNEGPGVTTSSNIGARAYSLRDAQRRLYQPFAVEVGVEYTISVFVRVEEAGEFTLHILDNEIENESTLEQDSLATLIVTGGVDNLNAYEEYTFTFVATTTTALFYGLPTGALGSDNEVFVDDISIATPGFDGAPLTPNNPVVDATEAAVVLNGDAEMFSFRDGFDIGGVASVPEGVDNDQDNADSFDMTPSSTIILDTGEVVPTIFTWSNSALNTFIETISVDNEGPGVTTNSNNGARAYSLREAQRRLYQPIAVQVGVEYTLSMFVRVEQAGEFTLHVLDNEIENESTLEQDSLATLVVTGGVNNLNAYEEYTVTFVATTTTALFYGLPTGALGSDNEVFVDDISIATPGF